MLMIASIFIYVFKILPKRIAFTIMFLMLVTSGISRQLPDTLEKSTEKSLLQKTTLPFAVIFTGSLVSGSAFEKNLQHEVRSLTGPDYRVTIDEYTQYAPVAQLYLASFTGVKARNHWFDQSKYLFLSNLATSLVVKGLKEVVNKPRPNGGSLSFPSGHTSVAFTNASVLFHEYEQTLPWLAWSGYGFALTTGAFRIANNEHWVSDVVASAGIAMLFTAIIYHYEPFRNFNPFLSRRNETAFRLHLGILPEGLNLMISF